MSSYMAPSRYQASSRAAERTGKEGPQVHRGRGDRAPRVVNDERTEQKALCCLTPPCSHARVVSATAAATELLGEPVDHRTRLRRVARLAG